MDETPLSSIARWIGAPFSGEERTVSRVCTDTRALRAGDLYLALKGERFDGHAFVSDAARAGAAAAVVEATWAGDAPAGLPLLRVADTLAALQQMAHAYRASLPLRVIGITGSSGKTSTKDFTAAVLGSRYRVMRTEGNLNNHIGLPLTLLAATVEDEVGIIEMGMNHPGEIAPLARIARPDAAIITNIGVAHLEYMGTRAAIAQEKGELAVAVPESGFVVLHAGDDFSADIASRAKGHVVLAGVSDDSAVAVRATILETAFASTRFRVTAGQESTEVVLPVPGLHMVENALLALAAGLQWGVSLAEGAAGLAQVQLTKGRLEQKSFRGIHVLDDTYNANPDSMRAALRTLGTLPGTGRRIAVLGRMGELGEAAEAAHRSVGDAAARSGADRLIAVGPEAAPIAEAARAAGLAEVHHVEDPAAAAALLAELAAPGDLILLKASRAARMERVLEHPFFTPGA